jgi:hypothetical protein
VYADRKAVEACDDRDAEVWYADARAGGAKGASVAFGSEDVGMEAVAIDKRARTKSKGYVEPTFIASDKKWQ